MTQKRSLRTSKEARNHEIFLKELLKKTKIKRCPADLATFTEQVLNGKLHLLCSDWMPMKMTL